jgi:hypothetical protein
MTIRRFIRAFGLCLVLTAVSRVCRSNEKFPHRSLPLISCDAVELITEEENTLFLRMRAKVSVIVLQAAGGGRTN